MLLHVGLSTWPVQNYLWVVVLLLCSSPLEIIILNFEAIEVFQLQ